VNDVKKSSPKYLIIASIIFGIMIVTSAIQAVLSPYPFIRLINVFLIIFLSGGVGAFIRELFILRRTYNQ